MLPHLSFADSPIHFFDQKYFLKEKMGLQAYDSKSCPWNDHAFAGRLWR